VALILDTGPILALIDAKEPAHDRCVALLGEVDETLVVPTLVLAEVDYWLRKRFDANTWKTFAEDVAEGAYRLYHPDEHDLLRAAELELEYESLRLGLVDASVIVACERLGETKVATLDHRHFSVVRPRHCEALRLLPE
jgi:predicted nucleic acid-binding protein